MKKYFFIFVFALALTIGALSFSPISFCSASTANSVKVISNSASVYAEASASSEVLFEATLADKFELISSQKIVGTNSDEFYNITANDSSAFILASKVCIYVKNITTNITPNCHVADTLETIDLYLLVDDAYALSQSSVPTIDLNLLITDGYDSSQEYTKILTVIDGDYFYGFVKTTDITPNTKSNLAVIIIVICSVILLILTTILTAYLKRKKKSKI